MRCLGIIDKLIVILFSLNKKIMLEGTISLLTQSTSRKCTAEAKALLFYNSNMPKVLSFF